MFRAKQSPTIFWPVVILLGVGLGIALVLLRVARPSNIAAPPPTVLSGPAASWPARARRAPNLQLRDEQGQPISLSSYRGRPVIITFIDPLCRNLCPVEAGILNNVENSLPKSARPTIVAVSVNPNGDSRANLLKDMQKWRVGHNWKWAVGSPQQLETVWHHYEIGVTVAKKTYAGITVGEVTHTEAAYVIDAGGYQRALYLFPFEATDVAHTVRHIADTT